MWVFQVLGLLCWDSLGPLIVDLLACHWWWHCWHRSHFNWWPSKIFQGRARALRTTGKKVYVITDFLFSVTLYIRCIQTLWLFSVSQFLLVFCIDTIDIILCPLNSSRQDTGSVPSMRSILLFSSSVDRWMKSTPSGQYSLVGVITNSSLLVFQKRQLDWMVDFNFGVWLGYEIFIIFGRMRISGRRLILISSAKYLWNLNFRMLSEFKGADFSIQIA